MVSLHTGKNSTHTGMAGVCFYNLKLICMKWESTSTADIVVDSVVESVISKIRSRSNVGIKKYNTTMAMGPVVSLPTSIVEAKTLCGLRLLIGSMLVESTR